MNYKSVSILLAAGILGWSHAGKAGESLDETLKELQNLPSDINAIYQYGHKAANLSELDIKSINVVVDQACKEGNHKVCLNGLYALATTAFFKSDRSKEVILFNQILTNPHFKAEPAYAKIEETIKKTFSEYKDILTGKVPHKHLKVTEEARKILENYKG
ncbi:MAG: hypothetical protein BGO76_01345 [Caedibacter sp. 38-128]|nr:hypothetical protein [Holosporales bacterium]OJX05465.1 MAG: hypothetical protein BGO76_01345 [Caedibacter sp. 38-128]